MLPPMPPRLRTGPAAHPRPPGMASRPQQQAEREARIKQDVAEIMQTFFCEVGRALQAPLRSGVGGGSVRTQAAPRPEAAPGLLFPPAKRREGEGATHSGHPAWLSLGQGLATHSGGWAGAWPLTHVYPHTPARRRRCAQTCSKQYTNAMELETHLSSYDHHHKKARGTGRVVGG